ncbi:hypothetical protein PanWU01x14_307330, partial [Parasponia andersonii]
IRGSRIFHLTSQKDKPRQQIILETANDVHPQDNKNYHYLPYHSLSNMCHTKLLQAISYTMRCSPPHRSPPHHYLRPFRTFTPLV